MAIFGVIVMSHMILDKEPFVRLPGASMSDMEIYRQLEILTLLRVLGIAFRRNRTFDPERVLGPIALFPRMIEILSNRLLIFG